jgi:hypothetical protein
LVLDLRPGSPHENVASVLRLSDAPRIEEQASHIQRRDSQLELQETGGRQGHRHGSSGM